MGAVLCDKHGQQGFYEMCEHVHDSLNQGIYPEMKEITLLNTLVCPDCYEKLKMGRIPEMTLNELIELDDKTGKEIDTLATDIYNRIPVRKAMCIKCVAEIKSNQS